MTGADWIMKWSISGAAVGAAAVAAVASNEHAHSACHDLEDEASALDAPPLYASATTHRGGSSPAARLPFPALASGTWLWDSGGTDYATRSGHLNSSHGLESLTHEVV